MVAIEQLYGCPCGGLSAMIMLGVPVVSGRLLEVTPTRPHIPASSYVTRSGSYEAIAQITGVPIGTVRSRLHTVPAAAWPTRCSKTAAGTESSNADRTESQRTIWHEFYDDATMIKFVYWRFSIAGVDPCCRRRSFGACC